MFPAESANSIDNPVYFSKRHTVHWLIQILKISLDINERKAQYVVVAGLAHSAKQQYHENCNPKFVAKLRKIPYFQ